MKTAAARVDDEAVLRALDVLERLADERRERPQPGSKRALFDEAGAGAGAEARAVVVQVACVKIPDCPARKIRFDLPRPLVTDSSEICLFVADLRRGKRVDHEPTVRHYRRLLDEAGVGGRIKTVMPVRQVRVELDQLELKRRMLTRCDVFLADARIGGLVCHKLGVAFHRKGRLPAPVRIHEGDVERNVERALRKTAMNVHGAGQVFTVRAALGEHSRSEKLENVRAVLAQLDERLPGGWDNVRSVHLKNPLSLAVPVYVTLKNQNLVRQTKIEPLHSRDGFQEDELSTALDATVRVYADGKVSVKRKRRDDDDQSREDDQSEIIGRDEEDDEPSVKAAKLTKTNKESKSKETKTRKKEKTKKNVKRDVKK